jgi:protein CMS1
MGIQCNAELQDPLLEVSVSEAQELHKTKRPESKRKRGLEQLSRKSTRTATSKRVKTDDLDAEMSVNTAFSRMDSELLADYVAQRTRKYESDLSVVELQDKYIPGTRAASKLWERTWLTVMCLASAFQDTTTWDKPRNLDNLPGFLEKFSGNSTKLWSASKKNGAPHTIIVTAAGLRAADMARFVSAIGSLILMLIVHSAVRKFHTNDATVAKLFAKHIKLKDAIRFLSSTRTGIAVGTPTRLKDLMDDGSSSSM